MCMKFVSDGMHLLAVYVGHMSNGIFYANKAKTEIPHFV